MKSWLAAILLVGWVTWAADEKPAAAPEAAAKDLPTARAVIDRYIQAAGGKEAFQKHSSILLKGKTQVAGQELGGPLTLATAKPNKMMLAVEIGGITMRTGFDGKVGWQVNPLTGPSLMEGKELEDAQRQADFFAILHEDSGFKSMENLGKVDFEGEPCYKLKLTHPDGAVVTEYYSVETGLQRGFTGTQETSLGSITATSVNNEHKKFGELTLPSKVTQKMAGTGLAQTMVVDSVEFDNVPDSIFEPPAEIKALLNAPKKEDAKPGDDKKAPEVPKKNAV
jgi:hypothetical protein